MNIEIINGKEYREVTIRGRTKLIAKDGDAINPHHRNQKATIHYNTDGYPCYGGGVPVHLYVAYGWVDGYFDGAEVNHIDYDRNNFNANNLEWVSHKDNIRHSSDAGRYKNIRMGSNNGRARNVVVNICDTNQTLHFESIGDCAKWLIENKYVRYTNKINNVRTRIINMINGKGSISGLTFQYI